MFFCTAKDKLHIIHFLPNNSWNLKTVWNTTLRLLPTLNNDTRVFHTFSNYIIWQIKYSFSLKLCTSSWTLTKLSRSTSFIIKELNPVKGTVPQAWQNLYCTVFYEFKIIFTPFPENDKKGSFKRKRCFTLRVFTKLFYRFCENVIKRQIFVMLILLTTHSSWTSQCCMLKSISSFSHWSIWTSLWGRIVSLLRTFECSSILCIVSRQRKALCETFSMPT